MVQVKSLREMRLTSCWRSSAQVNLLLAYTTGAEAARTAKTCLLQVSEDLRARIDFALGRSFELMWCHTQILQQ